MSNKFMNGLSATNTFGYTENGAVKRNSTGSDLYDMFALGAAYRTRSDDDCGLLFKNAYDENPEYALKCLFYIGDVREGQGERRFFRICYRWLIIFDIEAARRNLHYIPEFKRWDDLIKVCFNTPLWNDAMAIIRNQLELDVASLMKSDKEAISLLGKWLPSENTSSKETRVLAHAVRTSLGWTHKQYRTILSRLRERANVLERLMSAGRWDEIEFDAIPSKAGLKYKNAFARHDIERMQSDKAVQSYADFAKDKNTTVNAGTLYPYEVVDKAMKMMNSGYYCSVPMDNTDRLMVNKYWDNLTDYFEDATFNGMAIVDTSGSMCGANADAPINVAISLGLYCAEKAQGPFANHFITFSSNPTFVKTEGVDFCDKVQRMQKADWGGSTNIEAAFDLMLKTAIDNGCTQDEIPQNLIIISDMEFDSCATSNSYRSSWGGNLRASDTLFEKMEAKWAAHGYKMPNLVFWNCQARNNNIPMKVDGHVSFVSGMSPVLFEQIMSGKTAFDLMYDKLDSDRYSVIH